VASSGVVQGRELTVGLAGFSEFQVVHPSRAANGRDATTSSLLS